MQFVVLGQNVQLTAKIPKKFSNYTNADLDLSLDHGSTTARLLHTRVRLADGTGTHTWTATGLEEKELSAVVDVTWKGVGMMSSKTVTQQVFVYRTQVELFAVDGNDAGIAGAAYELKLTPHPQYQGPLTPVPTTGQTNGRGKAIISNLPPLQSLEVRWKNPNLLSDTGWINNDDFQEHGAKRKAVLRQGYRAQFVGVMAGTTLTRYVNLPISVDDDTAGPLAIIRAKVHASDGGGKRNDKIWARVTWADTNCKRSDKCPKLQGQSLVEAASQHETKVIDHRQLGADGGEVAFTFDCGVAGGDRFSLWVGGSPEAEDDGPIEIVTKRKFKLVPHFPPNYAFADRLFVSAFKKKLTDALAAAEIEVEITDAETITYVEQKDYGSHPPPMEVAADVCERLGWEAEIHHIYTHDLLFAPIDNSFKAIPDYPTIRAFYADGMLSISSKGQPFSVTGLTENTSAWITSGSGRTFFFPCDLDGKSMVALFQEPKPEENVYEYVYLWDEDANEFTADNHRDVIKTHVWAIDRQQITATCPWSHQAYPAFKGKLMPKAEAARTGRNLVPLTESGLPTGYVFNGPGYGEQTLVRTIPAVPSAWGEWRTLDGKSGKITMDHIEIEMDDEKHKYARFRFKLPEEAKPSPTNPASVSVGLRTVSSGVAGSSSGCAIILLRRGAKPDDFAAYALLHEIGHSFGQSWADKEGTSPGVEFDRKYLYGGSIVGSKNNRGHQGPHCAYGLADEYLVDTQDYTTLLVEQGLHGTCVMFGGVGPKTVYTDESRKFCPKCLPTIKSQDLSKIHGGQS